MTSSGQRADEPHGPLDPELICADNGGKTKTAA